MSYFANATITVTRSQGKRTPAGYEETGTTTVLQGRADFQESGRSLERLQQLHETGDGLLFCEDKVTEVKPGDDVTINHDDGRTLSGSIEETRPIDDSILVSL